MSDEPRTPHPSELLEFATTYVERAPPPPRPQLTQQPQLSSSQTPRSAQPLQPATQPAQPAQPEQPPPSHQPHPSELLEFGTNATFGQFAGKGGVEATVLSFDDKDGLTHRKFSADKNGIALPASLDGLAEDTKAAAKNERKMTFLQGLKLYPKAMCWSALISLTIVMEAYDLVIITGFFAFPKFKQSYGERQPDGSYQISTAWQSGLTNGGVAGEILGLFGNGILTERFGYRHTLMVALVALSGFIFLAFFAFHIEMLLASEILCGLSWGIFQTLSTTYAAEVMPVALRAYLTSNVNLCWLVGQLIGTSVLRGCLSFNSQWSYRVPFGLQWMWALPILIGVIFAPESPWWYIRRGRDEDAKKSLLRLTRRDQKNFNADETIAMMKYTNEVEKQISSGTTYWDCFKGSDRRRTEIACVVWMTQALCGSAMTGYATYFYEAAGFSPDRSFDLSTAMYGMAIIGGMMSWAWMRYCGRRTLYLWGCGLCTVTMLVAGIVGCLGDSHGVSWTLGSMIILFTFIYDSTIGPVCYSLVAEIASTRLRVKTVVLARISYNVIGLVSNLLMPKMLNPSAWNWKGKTCFFWAATCTGCWIWCYFRLPEPKGLTYLELDILFEKRASARKFRRFQDILASTGYFNTDEGPANDVGWQGNEVAAPTSPGAAPIRPLVSCTSLSEKPAEEKKKEKPERPGFLRKLSSYGGAVHKENASP